LDHHDEFSLISDEGLRRSGEYVNDVAGCLLLSQKRMLYHWMMPKENKQGHISLRRCVA